MRAPTNAFDEWPTLLLLAATYALWAAGTIFWQDWPVVAVLATGIAIAQHSSLQHEALHGHPFRNALLNEALVFPALGVFVPYRRFRDTHLQHHYDPALTDPYEDPESNFLDPAEWRGLPWFYKALLRINNTLAGRMILGPVLGTARFLTAEVRQFDHATAKAWTLHIIGLAMVAAWLVWWATMPLWAYFLAVYLGFALLRIRTFLEHRAADLCRARTVVIEDRGPLALLFLNNNFHAVHHMHPALPWYKLPSTYRERKAHYLRRNDGYVYSSYAAIFRAYFLRSKDPVAHPIWPVRKAPSQDC